MNWHNVKLIFLREARDQLRDRRTLFMIGVLPLLLYPLLAMAFLQVIQVVRERTSRVLVLSETDLPASPPLVDANNSRFDETLFDKASQSGDKNAQQDLLHVDFPQDKPWLRTQETPADYARRVLRKGDYEVIVLFPADFTERFENYRAELRSRKEMKSTAGDLLAVPSPAIYYNTAQEKSQIAYSRVLDVTRRWIDQLGAQNLRDQHVAPEAIKPVQFDSTDVAEEGHRDAATWSKILPFVLMIWALTGAFYPAVDLCAGEKERGTLETLLSSPAKRSEIVCGKLFTIMTFSMATSLLNLICMGATGMFAINQLQGMASANPLRHALGPPPALAPLWLALALVPISALFSALCLAVAAFARSTKEGQYYLMPLILVILPLMVLPMASGGELDLGQSLIPVTGVVLLLRAALEGNLQQVALYFAPVALVTIACCVFAIRWAVDQFNKESVLFREGERLDVGMWFRRLVNDREDFPSAGEALLCGALIASIQFFLSMAFARSAAGASSVVMMIVMPQLTAILTPALIMAVMLTRRPDRALGLRLPRWWAIPAAAVLAVLLQPIIHQFHGVVQQLYPPRGDQAGHIMEFQQALFGLETWLLILLAAALPACCEELAFRGFMLSGLRNQGSAGRAVVVSSLFFAFVHPIIQQSLGTFVLGVLLGYLALGTRSILPGAIFHLAHNSMNVLYGKYQDTIMEWVKDNPGNWLFQWAPPEAMATGLAAKGSLSIHTSVTIGATVLAAALLYAIYRGVNRTTNATAQNKAG